MRLVLPLLLAACASKPAGEPLDARGGPVRVIARQYYKGSQPIVLENLAGRDAIALRSREIRPGEDLVIYVDDAVMDRLLEDMEDFGFRDYARPRPADPRTLGARAEITVVRSSGRTASLLRVGIQDARAADVYQKCLASIMAVQNVEGTLQATAKGREFGVHRVEVPEE